MNSSELKGYLTGLIFGDGCIDKGITKRAFEIKSIDKNFIDKIKNDIESCTNFQISIKYTPAHERCGCNHKESWMLRIKAHPYFNKKYHHFYDDYKNRIASKEALNWITPNGIANWYMCDGYVCLVGRTKGVIKNRRIDFCTDRYNLNTIKSMKDMFNKRFDIQTSIVKRGKFYRLRVCQNSYEKFINLVYPYMVDTMMYKLYLGYEYQPKWMSDDMWNLQKNLQSAITLTDNAEG